MNVLAFAASSSTQSINKKLVRYAASLLEGAQVQLLDLNDYELPLFSVDKEKKLGQPQLAHDFVAKIGACDALIISFAEHNGTYTAAYKNLFDWGSRINKEIYQDKPIVLLATSPGPGGAGKVLEVAVNSIPHFNGDLRASLSIPSFHQNFDPDNNCLSNSALNDELIAAISSLQ
ncbi:MAG: NAD(P)H-dependent oxidoreductase [Gammaproteobacteria bacterium]|jgi:chromate reductase, NAD(P)H dehydrogenase (quinone)|nr:NAD(P)H-dependent oxidoreductase [Gammaproteobacteria bacterium]MBT4145432.1 NAD(P)H-dependent oxidoreductase [Gammaproteobacteria bacterium]MBT5223337.1 NAD(P)H-dependent oxidoreductase [Gammaproteobacteria bacterium]MBT5825249.1 NAD(P)H-dependent oxidoreductase [Gammaproteobacteria bacterium]MBT5967185.1 NAD(P)H-dependent oxidoreductase [Gammaproteobacteria bacterium]